MFLHSDSEMCKFKEKCNKKLCQFKHVDYDDSNTDDDKNAEEVDEMIFICVKFEHKFKTKN